MKTFLNYIGRLILGILLLLLLPLFICLFVFEMIFKIIETVSCVFGIHRYEQIGDYMLKCKVCGLQM